MTPIQCLFCIKVCQKLLRTLSKTEVFFKKRFQKLCQIFQKTCSLDQAFFLIWKAHSREEAGWLDRFGDGTWGGVILRPEAQVWVCTLRRKVFGKFPWTARSGERGPHSLRGGGVSGWASGRGPPQGLKRSCAGGLFIMSSRSNNRALAVTVGAFVFFFALPEVLWVVPRKQAQSLRQPLPRQLRSASTL